MSDRATAFPSYSNQRLAELLPFPSQDAHKYSRGVVDFYGGSEHYAGAAILAVRAAQRMGAGYVSAVVSPEAARAIHVCAPSAVARPWSDAFDILREGAHSANVSHLGEVLIPEALKQSGCKRAAVLGPGLNATEPGAACLVASLLRQYSGPAVVDGGALGSIADSAVREALLTRIQSGYPTVLTPHVGEAKRLARHLDVAVTDAEPIAAEYASALAAALGCVVAVKSHVTYICDGSQHGRGGGPFAMEEGTAALAKAGSGDVLAGMIGALLAQGLAPLDAAVLGCHLHARAGVAASKVYSEISTVPEDVIDCIPAAIRMTAEAFVQD